jgi:AraC-like DNA-binding protein
MLMLLDGEFQGCRSLELDLCPAKMGSRSGGRGRRGGRKLDGMLYRSYTPASPLTHFIEDFWLYDDYEPRHLKERILPSGTVELVINLRDNELRIYDRMRPGVCERFSGAIVSGPYDRFFVIDTAEEASLLGVHFRPAGALPFSRCGAVTVRDVSDRIGLSHRRFIEVFKTGVGLTPKLFHRVQRFQRTLALVRRVTAPDWSRLAQDCGFFDQSHLIRDFVEFSGFSPAEFARHLHELERRGVHLKRNHLPLAT